MYSGLVHTHSGLRYVVLSLLIVVVVKSLLGLMNNQPFKKVDDKLSLWLLIATHIQFLLGLGMYFVSPLVKFSGAAFREDKAIRYWTAEHSVMMILAVVLITVARITHKKLSGDTAKHKRLFILNAVALGIIVTAIFLSGRGFF